MTLQSVHTAKPVYKLYTAVLLNYCNTKKLYVSTTVFIIIIININILTAIGLAPGGSSPVHIYREHYIEYTNNTQNT